MVYKIASFISHFFSPFILLPLFLFVLVANSPYSTDLKLISAAIIGFTGILPILLTTIYLKKTRKISDWEMRNRQERYPLYLSSMAIGLMVVLLLNFVGVTFLLNYLILLVTWHVTMVLINFFWKISSHVGSVTVVVLLLIQLYGIYLWPLVALIPLVSWSRVYRKNHTVSQVIGGFLLASLVVWLANRIGLV